MPVQKCLNALNASPKLVADGDFGPRTEQATRGFQTFCRLAADGIACPDTYRGARFFLALAEIDVGRLWTGGGYAAQEGHEPEDDQSEYRHAP